MNFAEPLLRWHCSPAVWALQVRRFSPGHPEAPLGRYSALPPLRFRQHYDPKVDRAYRRHRDLMHRRIDACRNRSVANITVSLGTNITSRLLPGGGPPI